MGLGMGMGMRMGGMGVAGMGGVASYAELLHERGSPQELSLQQELALLHSPPSRRLSTSRSWAHCSPQSWAHGGGLAAGRGGSSGGRSISGGRDLTSKPSPSPSISPSPSPSP